MKAVLGKAGRRLDIEDCGARDAQASAPWTSTNSQLHKTLTHKDTLMRDNGDMQGPIIRSGGGGRRTQNKLGKPDLQQAHAHLCCQVSKCSPSKLNYSFPSVQTLMPPPG